MLNPNNLQTFVKLVEVGHFGQTAEQLYMTQPGVTQHIKKLEQQVGMALLNRLGKRFELTEVGRELYQYAKQLIKDQALFVKQLGEDNPAVGECLISCSGSMAMLIYPHLIEYQQSHPQLSISVEAAPNRRIIEDVLANTVDLGIITQRVEHPELTVTGIGFQNLCVVLPKQFQHCQVDYDCLCELGMINHPDGMLYWQQIVDCFFASFSARASQIKQQGYVNQLNQILLPVSKGLGFAVLPEYAVQQSSFAQQVYVAAEFGGGSQGLGITEPLSFITKTNRQLPSRYQPIMDIITPLV